MKIIKTEIPDVLIIEPKVFGDARGFFFESYNEQRLAGGDGPEDPLCAGQPLPLREGGAARAALPDQAAPGEAGALVIGEVFDVAVDIRRSSATFGRWVGVRLSAENKRQLWVPEGFAHGFLVLSEVAEFLYKATDFYAPEHERSILWNDPQLAIDWPLDEAPTLSEKDRRAPRFTAAEVYP